MSTTGRCLKCRWESWNAIWAESNKATVYSFRKKSVIVYPIGSPALPWSISLFPLLQSYDMHYNKIRSKANNSQISSRFLFPFPFLSFSFGLFPHVSSFFSSLPFLFLPYFPFSFVQPYFPLPIRHNDFKSKRSQSNKTEVKLTKYFLTSVVKSFESVRWIGKSLWREGFVE